MILDIDKWKYELRSLRNNLQSACENNDEFQIERHLYYLAIAMRKLMDNRLAPRNFGTESVPIRRYNAKSGAIDGLNYLDAEAHFDLSIGQADQINKRRIVDLIIHSSFLDWRLLNRSAVEFIVSSDKKSIAVGVQTKHFSAMVDSMVNAEFKVFPLPSARRQ